jgi:nucleoside-diphosphate-sugar epimerase
MTHDHPLSGRRILVTGAEGRIGTAVCERLAGLGAVITGLSLVGDDQDPPDTIDRVLRGDTTDEATVADAFEGVDLVVHLAAIPSPINQEPFAVYRTNVVSTFNVLSQAGERGITRAVIASSINATGLPFNSHSVLPAYLPIDETMPSDLDDAYSLSKFSDEITARMVHRHWGVDVIALRFPLTAPADNIQSRARQLADRPEEGLLEGWSYLDVRDAALAVEKSLCCPTSGAHAVFVAADRTCLPYPTEDVLDRFAPSVPRTRAFTGNEVPINLTRARTLLGFRAEHELELELRELP